MGEACQRNIRYDPQPSGLKFESVQTGRCRCTTLPSATRISCLDFEVGVSEFVKRFDVEIVS